MTNEKYLIDRNENQEVDRFQRAKKVDEGKYLRRHKDELINTKAVITPICLVVDRSGSMSMFKDENNKTRMDRLNEGIKTFLDEIKNDDMLADSVLLSIIGFLDDADDDPYNQPVEEILKFSTIDNIDEIKIESRKRSGDTPLGVEAALDSLDKEQKLLIENRCKYNYPWIVIFSDGRATPSKKHIKENGSKDFTDINKRLNEVQKKTRDLEKNRKLNVIPVLISENVDIKNDKGYEQMKNFSSEKRAIVLGDDKNTLTFKDFFKILGKSVSVSNANLLFKNTKNFNDESDEISNDFNMKKVVEAQNTEEQNIKVQNQEVHNVEQNEEVQKQEVHNVEQNEEVQNQEVQNQEVQNTEIEESKEQEIFPNTLVEKGSVKQEHKKKRKNNDEVIDSTSLDDYLKDLLNSTDDWDSI